MTLRFLFASLALSLTSIATAATVVGTIDDFSEGLSQALIILGDEPPGTGTETSTVAGASIFGGDRQATLTVTTNTLEEDGQLFMATREGSDPGMIILFGAGNSGSAVLSYSASAAEDFLAGGADSILLRTSVDVPAILEVIATDGDGDMGSLSFASTTAGFQEIEFEYSSFSNPGLLDFGSIEALQVRFEPSVQGGVVSISAINRAMSIPEPGAASMVLFGLSVALALRRRRR